MTSVLAFLPILFISIAVMLLVLAVVRRHPAAKRLALTNDIAGFYITLAGTLYGVLVGFTVLVAWTRFDQAEVLVESEATALSNIYVLVGQLDDAKNVQVRSGLQRYAYLVVNEEWPIMEAGRGKSQKALDALLATWKIMVRFQPKETREQLLMSEAFDQMSELYKTRRLRLLANEKQIPFVFWMVLIVGALLTVGSTALFGVERFSFHALKISILTTLVCLTLYAIWEIDQPFRHHIHISAEPFYNHSVMNRTDQHY